MPTTLAFFGFKEDPSTPKTGGADEEFEVLVNPAGIKHKKGMLFNTDNRANGSIDVKQWKGYSEEILNFSLILDGSGYAYEAGDTNSFTKSNMVEVEDQVKQLMKTIYDYDGGTHKPMYVVVNWNSYAFLGHVKDLEVEYKMFDPEGKPIYATIEIEFTIHMNNEAAAKKQNRNSPDMSHLQTIKDGDKIPLICNDIYDDPTYYVQIAELNGLTNFRDVSAGKKLLFPPLIND